MGASRRLDFVVACLVIIPLSGAGAAAADQLIAGKKLLLKNPPAGAPANKVVHLGKDPAITVGAAGGAGDPQCGGAGGGGASSLRIAASGGAGDVTVSLPCGGWKTNGPNTLYKYKDPTGATCTLVLVKNGVLAKAVCKGAQIAIDLNGAMSPVAVVTTLNTERYCAEYGGTAVKDGGDDKTFLRKDAPAPVSCATIVVPASTTTTTPTTPETSTTPSTSTSTSTVVSTTTSTSCDVASWAGDYSGTYTGDENGTWTATVAPDGTMSVEALSPSCGLFSGVGTISACGTVDVETAGSGICSIYSITWAGTFGGTPGAATGSGTWNSSSGFSGSWSGGQD